MELPQAGVTGLGGPAAGRDVNATTAGPLPGGGGGGAALAPTPVASQDVIEWPALVEAWQILGETDPTECPAACRRHKEPIRATFDDSPSSAALSSRRTCKRWRKRSCSPCLHGARRQRRPEDAYPPSRQWLPWGGSAPCNGRGCGEFPRRQWIPRDNDSSEGPTCSSSWPNRAPGRGSGKSMLQQSYPSPRSVEWVKYRPSAGRTSPRWELCTKGSSETIATSDDDWGRTRRPGLCGSAGSHPVRRHHWDGQRISKWVWPSSCRGPTGQRPGGMPGDERAQPTSDGGDFRGDTSCGGVGGIASKLPTYTHLPPTNLNVCRLRDCLGQPLKESAGERPTSGTSSQQASWSSSKMTKKSADPRRRPTEHDSQVETAGPKRREPQRC